MHPEVGTEVFRETRWLRETSTATYAVSQGFQTQRVHSASDGRSVRRPDPHSPVSWDSAQQYAMIVTTAHAPPEKMLWVLFLPLWPPDTVPDRRKDMSKVPLASLPCNW